MRGAQDMHHVWEHTFRDRLKIDPTECRILLTDPPLNPVKNREVRAHRYGWHAQNAPLT